MTTKVEKSIRVDVPVTTAYDQWTQFEEFPRFMGGVSEVRQQDDRHLHWVAEIAGVRREWDATIVEQEPDRKVAWAATGGATNAGAVRFEPAGPTATTVYLELEYEPEGIVEQVGDKLNIVERQVVSDLERFKELIESQGAASGGWRGSVNEAVDMGTPGVEDAAASRGDSGKAGMSTLGKVAGAAAAVAGVAAAGVAAATAASSDEEQATTRTQPQQAVQPQEVAVVDQPPRDAVRDQVLIPASDSEGYSADTSTEGVQQSRNEPDDDPMIGGARHA